MKKSIGSIAFLIILIAGVVVLIQSLYVVYETDQVIITRFGDVQGETVTEAGLHFKVPFIDTVNRIEKRILEWDGPTQQMATKDKTYIRVDTYGRWQISNPRLYFETFRVERRAQSRLDDILGSETRNAVAKHDLIEVIRSTKGREPLVDESLGEAAKRLATLEEIEVGRPKLEAEIEENAKPKLEDLGIELLDVRFKRVNYNPEVLQNIYDRMISERKQIAELFRSQGKGEAARILGEKERELNRIESEAYRQVEEIKGEADAKATQIYADAYNRNDSSREFYQFIKTMEIYPKIIDRDSTMILSTDSDLFEYFKGVDPKSRKPIPSPLGEEDELPLFLRDQ